MASFRTRIKKLSKEKGNLILANDYSLSSNELEKITIKNIKSLHNYLCGLKLNFHLLLPLGSKELTNINKIAHKHNLQTIADIKLNDIGNTNKITTEHLWKCGFDAVIINPIMGQDSIKNLVNVSHKQSKGVISLCHMSAPESRFSYELDIKSKHKKLYQLFLDWAIKNKTDGIIVGATYPKIIHYCKNKIKNKLDIYSPGIGTQGGKINDVLSSGSNFLIVGRTILSSKDPLRTTKKLHQEIFNK